MSEAREAGEGDHHLYRLVPPGQHVDGGVRPDVDYVGIDAASWFLNKESGWFTDRTASGTLRVTLASGHEEYHAALGTFDLADGARTAPVFDRPMLADRRYRGGPLTFSVSLVSLSRDTAFASVLKSAADASLGIVAGMVETATHLGPQQVLGAAGGSLVRGIHDALVHRAEDRQPVFGGNGIEGTVRATELRWPVSYLLFHRGSRLDLRRLKTARYGQARVAIYDGNPLTDGAWLLLRIRRSTRYSGVRAWFDDVRRFHADLEHLVGDTRAGVVPVKQAVAQLGPGEASPTLYDEFTALRRTIRDDGVLTLVEAQARVAQLSDSLGEARSTLEALRVGGDESAASAPAHGPRRPRRGAAAPEPTPMAAPELAGNEEPQTDADWTDNGQAEVRVLDGWESPAVA